MRKTHRDRDLDGDMPFIGVQRDLLTKSKLSFNNFNKQV